MSADSRPQVGKYCIYWFLVPVGNESGSNYGNSFHVEQESILKWYLLKVPDERKTGEKEGANR